MNVNSTLDNANTDASELERRVIGKEVYGQGDIIFPPFLCLGLSSAVRNWGQASLWGPLGLLKHSAQPNPTSPPGFCSGALS